MPNIKSAIKRVNTIKTKRRIKALVVGMGPSGLFNAYILNKAGIDVTLIDKGDCVEERVKKVNNFFETGILDESCNIQFGEGGAGAYSDGKLTKAVTKEYDLGGSHNEMPQIWDEEFAYDEKGNVISLIEREGCEIVYRHEWAIKYKNQ